jgi:IclR family pca regulon transcriptional regulator
MHREYVQGVHRAFAVIKAFSDTPALTIAQVAARAGLTRAVARRYLMTLEQLGYVMREGTRFSLTPRLLELSYAYLDTLTVADVARPYVEGVVRTLNVSSSLAVLDGFECVYLVRIPAKRIITSSLKVGSRVPAYATALGKVLLAYLSDEELDRYFQTVPLQRLTPRTLCNEEKLRRDLRKTRDQGWAFADEELVAGRRTIAAPVFDRQDRVTAAINVAAAVALISTREMLDEHLPVLLAAARNISRALGARVSNVVDFDRRATQLTSRSSRGGSPAG